MSSLVRLLIVTNALLSFTLSQLFVIPLLLATLKFILSKEKRD
ncbi:MAG: hypothetical protein QXY68_06860 [Saccharolobus sp.]